MKVERSAVDLGDGLDDREPKAGALVRAGPLSAQASEGLRKLINVVIGEDRSTVLHNDAGREPSTSVVTRIQPPASLCLTALSMTFSTMRDSKVSLPLIHASGHSARSTLSPA